MAAWLEASTPADWLPAASAASTRLNTSTGKTTVDFPCSSACPGLLPHVDPLLWRADVILRVVEVVQGKPGC